MGERKNDIFSIGSGFVYSRETVWWTKSSNDKLVYQRNTPTWPKSQRLSIVMPFLVVEELHP